MEFERKDHYDMQDLLRIVQVLRAPGGCPWDQAQTHQSIRANLIEETYEVADAIDEQDAALLCEELGDLLLQIVLHTQMEQEAGTFTFADVCDGICKKLVYRHPHVFGSVQVNSAAQVTQNWEVLKNAEKGRLTAADRLESVPISLPALMRTVKLQKRADDFGFGYPEAAIALADLKSEVAELEEALAKGENIPHEIGDVLFSAANVARLTGQDAEEALTHCNSRFTARVKMVEQLAESKGHTLQELNPEQRDILWKEAKQKLQK
ncbi:nucleoside triphosphate pyrophosphohydrolase [Ruminococcaceae bacterium OttesenSCG-928-A16]|nr:nucleoside triphosphate pyrophosphohydrolase [Ruminococcaceae bacterium OttesenSCG-928-A16]